jgi:hypothetical protein
MTWDEAACWLLVGALYALLAYGAGQLLMLWLTGGL